MPVSTRLSAIAVLQNAMAAAANGIMIDITDSQSAIVEVSGTYTGITANFEGSIDAGLTWYPVSLTVLSNPSGVRASTAATNGLYFLEYARPMNAFRARTTVATPTGSMTVRARGSIV
jgi:hypothetical protein